MSISSVLSALYRYPVKSMRGQSLAASPVSPQGCPSIATGWWPIAPEISSPGGPIRLVRSGPRPRDDGVTLSVAGRTDLFVPNTAFTLPLETTVWGDSFRPGRGPPRRTTGSRLRRHPAASVDRRSDGSPRKA
jgi:uncharacterized protein YcbX